MVVRKRGLCGIPNLPGTCMTDHFLTTALLIGQVLAVCSGVTHGVGFLHTGPILTAVGERTAGDPCKERGKQVVGAA